MNILERLSAADRALEDYRELPGVRIICPSPDGAGAAWGRLDNRLIAGGGEWRLESHEVKAGAHDRIRAIAHLEAGGWAAAAGTRIWRITSEGGIEWSIRSRNTWGFLISTPSALCPAPAGMAAAHDSGIMEIISPQGEVVARRTDAHAPSFLALVQGGAALAGADGQTVSLWCSETLQPLQRRTLTPHIHSGAASESGLLLRVDGGLILLSEGLEIGAAVPLPPGSGPFAAPSPDGGRALVGVPDGYIELELESRDFRFQSMPSRVLSAAFHPSGRSAWIGMEDGSVEEMETLISPAFG